MPFTLNDRTRAMWSAAAAEAFPDVRGVWTNERTLLAELPKAGTGLHVLCCGCWDCRWVCGQDICRRWPDWLLRPGIAWARTLRCAACGQKRFRFTAEADTAAAGFGNPMDPPSMAFARRLQAWLPEDGPTVYDFADRLAAMPTADEMRDAGL